MKTAVVLLLTVILGLGCASVRTGQAVRQWPGGASPIEVGSHVARYTVENHMGSINYQNVCCAYGVLMFANATGDQNLLRRVELAYDPYLWGDKKDTRNYHQGRGVVAHWFGFIPLELFGQTCNGDYVALARKYAEEQFENAHSDGLPGYTRFWVDDMYGIGTLQGLARKYLGDLKYADRGINALLLHAETLQQPNGLFHHTAGSARFFWGRGNGWAAAGMAEMLLALPKNHRGREELLAVYRRQMKGLLKFQHESGAWRQLIDHPDSWVETSGTSMFVFAMSTGVERGWLAEKPYRAAAERGWLALASHVDEQGRLNEVCVGTGGRDSADKYLGRPRVPGDAHGQGALLWAASAVMRMNNRQ
jgi:rhamnogalacturonyl hydrolase YesR